MLDKLLSSESDNYVMGSHEYGGTRGLLGESLQGLDCAVTRFLGDAMKHDEDLLRRQDELAARENFVEEKEKSISERESALLVRENLLEKSISERESALLVRENLLENREKTISEQERVTDRGTRKIEHLNRLNQQLHGTRAMLEEGKRQILEDKQQYRKQMDEAMTNIKREAEKEREDLVGAVIQEIEGLRLPSANISFKNETAAVNELVSEVKKLGNECLNYGINNNMYLSPEDFGRRRE